MELNDIRIGSILRNTHTGKLYLVENLAATKLFLKDDTGAAAQYKFIGQFELATEAEAAQYAQEREKNAPKKEVKILGVYDEADTRSKMAEYTAKIKPEHQGAFDDLWKKVLAVIEDKPGQTWRVRNSKAGPNPVIRVASAAGNWVDGIHVFADYKEGTAIGLVIMREVLPEAFAASFPEKTMYGQGREGVLPYGELSDEKLKPYLDCIKAITAKKAAKAEAPKAAEPAPQSEPAAQP